MTLISTDNNKNQEIVKNVLYVPETTRSRKNEKFKPDYSRFIKVILSIAVGYAYNKFNNIKNLRK